MKYRVVRREGVTGKLKMIKNKSSSEVIRISTDNYELLRNQAFIQRTTIRKLADEILAHELKKKYN